MKKTIGVLAALILLLAVGSSAVVTYPNEYRLVRQFGEIVRVIETPGFSLKIPVIQDTTSVPKCLQIYDIPRSDVITRDKKSMIADAFVLWRISDPVLFTRHLNGQVAQAQSRISASVFSSMKAVISNMDQSEIIENRDGQLAEDIRNNLGGSLSGYGIEVLAVETKSLDMPDDNKQAVYDRMISERNNIAASYTAQGNSEAQMIRNNTSREVSVMKSEAEAEAEKIRAEGEARYMQILSGAYNDEEKADFYSFVRALDAAEKSMQGGNKTLLLDRDSPLTQLFYGSGESGAEALPEKESAGTDKAASGKTAGSGASVSTAGSAAAGSKASGSAAAGSGTAGSGTAGSAAAGSSAAGSAADSTAGSSAAGNKTAGTAGTAAGKNAAEAAVPAADGAEKPASGR